VIDLVKKEVQLLELDHKSWIIEGFPRTKLQALALQKIGVIPDRFILLNVERDRSIAQLKKTLSPFESIYGKEEIDRMAQNSMNEYDLHIKNVRTAFNHFIYDYNAFGRSQSDVANDIARMLRIKFKSSGPRRPARVILLGPPGSGRSTQAKAIGERFGLVYVCTRRLLKHEVSRGTPAG
jgi:adenylate kinase